MPVHLLSVLQVPTDVARLVPLAVATELISLAGPEVHLVVCVHGVPWPAAALFGDIVCCLVAKPFPGHPHVVCTLHLCAVCLPCSALMTQVVSEPAYSVRPCAWHSLTQPAQCERRSAAPDMHG
jgi:hypothetical protein